MDKEIILHLMRLAWGAGYNQGKQGKDDSLSQDIEWQYDDVECLFLQFTTEKDKRENK